MVIWNFIIRLLFNQVIFAISYWFNIYLFVLITNKSDYVVISILPFPWQVKHWQKSNLLMLSLSCLSKINTTITKLISISASLTFYKKVYKKYSPHLMLNMVWKILILVQQKLPLHYLLCVGVGWTQDPKFPGSYQRTLFLRATWFCHMITVMGAVRQSDRL